MTPKRNPEATCATCPFWHPHRTKGEEGNCRRFPPTAFYDAESGMWAQYPYIESDQVCGEHPDFFLPPEEQKGALDAQA